MSLYLVVHLQATHTKSVSAEQVGSWLFSTWQPTLNPTCNAGSHLLSLKIYLWSVWMDDIKVGATI